MPQMAPSLWLPIFTLIIFIVIWGQAAIYFYKTHSKTNSEPLNFHLTTWLW
uniref:ATP synthase F0 subunit 8 n=1 Tax=Gmelinoides fasciatus TaxID=686704 RepID=A0A1L5BW41_9CRUS|nr:ATP synthase F0 subunit 8 [Gmelinoides fasciatus]APL97185.1 ATP synthase F0 subunit 8 [Gmelinoides fasciatus]